MKKFEHNIVVRYAETDQMGFVYYANYFVFFESARSDFLRTIGLPYKELEKKGLFLPVVEAYAKYISPAFYEDELTVFLWIEEIKSASLIIKYEVLRKNDSRLICEGFTKHTLLNSERKIIRIPYEIKTKLEEFMK